MRPRSIRRIASLAVVFALLDLASSPSPHAEALFPNPVYAVGANPNGMARADFDGDGHADLVISNMTQEYYEPGTGEVSFLRGLGDGTYAAETRIPVSHRPSASHAADFNGDGNADLAIEYWLGAAVLFGAGDGTFGPELTLSSGKESGLRVADFNADGHADLLLTTYPLGGAGQTQPLLGQANGTFTTGPVLGATGLYSWPQAADINGDGFDDIIAMTGPPSPCQPSVTNTVRVFYGDGAGQFSEAGSFGTGVWNDMLLPADLDGDGHLDLIIGAAQYQGCSGIGGRRIYYGNGDATFTAAGPFEPQVWTNDVVAADFDHDGLRDWIETDGYAVTMHLGQGNRTFTDLPWFLTGSDSYALRAGDDDGDGEIDLAILATSAEAVFTYLGNGDGTFGPARIPALTQVVPTGAATADFDGDGHLDVVANSFETGEVVVVPGDGTGGFGAEVRYSVGTRPDDLLTADFNGDGAPDIAVVVRNASGSTAGSLALLLNNGDGTFASAQAYTTGPGPIGLTAGDVDGDGATDVIVANAGSPSLNVYGDLSLFLGNGDGTLQGQVRLPVGVKDIPPSDPTRPVTVATGDFNGDTHPDIVVGMRGTSNGTAEGDVEILYGDGNGGFAPYVAVHGAARAESVAVGDLNGDGLQDIAVADMASGRGWDPGGVTVLFSHGDGTFTPSPLLSAGPGPLDVRIDDFNADGTPDLAASNNGEFLSLLPATGGGSFGPRLDFALFGVPLAIVKGDFDGDGTPDLLVLSSGGTFLFRNASAPLRFGLQGGLDTGGKRTATLRWTTTGETDLVSFNVVLRDRRGDRLVNTAPILCAECTTGGGHEYSYVLPKVKKGQSVLVEVVHAGGATEMFGPFGAAGAGAAGSPTGKPSGKP